LFRSNTDQHERVERLFLISPRLIPARRSMSASAPMGPLRPGGAVAAPTVPAMEEPSSPARPVEPVNPSTGLQQGWGEQSQ
jgi:type III secretion protein C